MYKGKTPREDSRYTDQIEHIARSSLRMSMNVNHLCAVKNIKKHTKRSSKKTTIHDRHFCADLSSLWTLASFLVKLIYDKTSRFRIHADYVTCKVFRTHTSRSKAHGNACPSFLRWHDFIVDLDKRLRINITFSHTTMHDTSLAQYSEAEQSNNINKNTPPAAPQAYRDVCPSFSRRLRATLMRHRVLSTWTPCVYRPTWSKMSRPTRCIKHRKMSSMCVHIVYVECQWHNNFCYECKSLVLHAQKNKTQIRATFSGCTNSRVNASHLDILYGQWSVSVSLLSIRQARKINQLRFPRCKSDSSTARSWWPLKVDLVFVHGSLLAESDMTSSERTNNHLHSCGNRQWVHCTGIIRLQVRPDKLFWLGSHTSSLQSHDANQMSSNHLTTITTHGCGIFRVYEQPCEQAVATAGEWTFASKQQKTNQGYVRNGTRSATTPLKVITWTAVDVACGCAFAWRRHETNHRHAGGRTHSLTTNEILRNHHTAAVESADQWFKMWRGTRHEPGAQQNDVLRNKVILSFTKHQMSSKIMRTSTLVTSANRSFTRNNARSTTFDSNTSDSHRLVIESADFWSSSLNGMPYTLKRHRNSAFGGNTYKAI